MGEKEYEVMSVKEGKVMSVKEGEVCVRRSMKYACEGG